MSVRSYLPGTVRGTYTSAANIGFSFPGLVLLDTYKEVQICRVPRRRAFLLAR